MEIICLAAAAFPAVAFPDAAAQASFILQIKQCCISSSSSILFVVEQMLMKCSVFVSDIIELDGSVLDKYV